MAIFLVQHGLSLPKDDDPKKGLSQEGRDTTVRIAEVAKAYRVLVGEICHSGKARAEQTAAIFGEYLAPKGGIRKIDGINPMDDVKAFAGRIVALENAMVVGHLPFMERLTGYLTCGDAVNRVFRFQNSGIVCMDREDGNWFIKWSLSPEIS